MSVLYFLLGIPLVVGVVIAIYEWRSKRTLLAHDLTKSARQGPHANAERIRAEDAALKNPSSGMY